MRSARRPGARMPISRRRRDAAPPAVAAHTASDGVSPMSRTASAITKGIEVVYDDPGLQSDAIATVTPASHRRRAGAYADRVENSAPGTSVATVPEPASASISSSHRWVQWSTEGKTQRCLGNQDWIQTGSRLKGVDLEAGARGSRPGSAVWP